VKAASIFEKIVARTYVLGILTAHSVRDLRPEERIEMGQIDKRFALIRDGEPWYAALITARGSTLATYRISTRRETRDAYLQAEHLSDIETVVQRVLKEGKRMRSTPENGPASSLDLKSKGVKGYCLNPSLAIKLGVAAKGIA
jgi:hypothetical protein